MKRELNALATPAQQRVLAVGETRDRTEASEKPPFPWNLALRRPPNRAKMEVGMYQTAIQGVAPGDGVIDECELL